MIFRCRLIVDGVELAVAGASLDAPEGGLGFGLTVALAQRHPGGVPPGATLSFAIGVKERLSESYVWVMLIEAGKLLGRDYSMLWEEGEAGRPGDTVSFNALSPLADRWALRPLIPITLYNPATVDAGTLTVDPATALKDGLTGAPILPRFEPINGLNLRQVLDRVYTNRLPILRAGFGDSGAGVGCGFSRVVTNLPDFPVDRVDITLEGGFHAAAAGLIAVFEPIYFELDNVLYIIDPGRGLPASFPTRSLSLDCMGEAQHIIAPGEVVNSIILSYQTRDPARSVGSTAGGIAGLIPSERFEPPTIVETPTTRMQITRKLRDWKDLSTGQTAYTQEIEVETSSYVMVDGALVPASLETLQVDYQGKLKAGHLRTTQARYPNPDIEWTDPDVPEYTFKEVHTETCRIDWTVDPSNPGESIEKRVVTETEGVVLVEGDARKTYTPILDAAKSNLIKGDGTQTTVRRQIDTAIDELRITGDNQAQIVPYIFHHLTGTPETPPPTISRTGTPSTASSGRTGGAGANGLASVRELYLLTSSITAYGARRAATLDVGQLDPVEGRRLVQRRLERLANPRKRAPFTIPNGIDFLLHKGSVVRVPLRDASYETSYMIVSYKITLRGLLTDEPSITHSLDGIELG